MSDPIYRPGLSAVPAFEAEGNSSASAEGSTGVPPGAGRRPVQNAAAITSRLRHAIEAGEYSKGDQLPPERDLAERFGAARSTVRRALDRLERAGLVSRKVGSGTFVTWSGGLDRLEDISDAVSPLQLVEMRFAIEPYMSELAVLHATRKDLESMSALLDRLERLEHDKDAFSEWDAEFHLSLAQASRNPLIVYIYRQINEVRLHAQWNAQKEKTLHPARIATYNRQHRAIFDALCQRDAETVKTLLREHLELARTDLIANNSD
ncbi:FadR/GntR family transcriptional regulator [Methyloligella sp. 2.7D]|uniref:FadR/GntR family transcriptional regulator n=1 Tax=unclassified Methyloligella TaxID=2625955 RepID=UPI00157D08D3|nr:FadR/GntR family transcriptional regulator [Methyloligella sp. GL2]QKP77284.1 FadR family transcriptional regulator [Methyloligella sp. GL2]